MTKDQIKNALVSIVIGAITIFITQLLQGLIHFLNDLMVNTLGGTTSAGAYLWKTYKPTKII